MAGKRLVMSKEKEIVRLNGLGIKERAIARLIKCSRNTVRKVLSGKHSIVAPLNVPIWVLDLDWNEIHQEFSKGGTS